MPNRRTRTKVGNEERKEYETSIYDGSERIDAMRDEGIDFSDIPEQGRRAFFAHAILWPGTKQQLTLRFDPDVPKLFRKQGRRCQTTENVVPRKYMEAESRR